MTNGYIRIRWYQQNVQGTNFSTSLKYKLPTVETIAVNQAINKGLFITFIYSPSQHHRPFSLDLQ